MANTVVISRTHLIYGVCLPLAVFLGYFLAEPFDLGSIAVVAIVLGILSIPLLMRWHHPLLIISCNAMISFYFLPGRPALGAMATALSFGILLLNRTIGWNVNFFKARNVSRSLIFMAIVVIVTAYASGGVGFNILGSRTIGSKRYLALLLGLLTYFGLSGVSIPRRWAGFAVSAFFLSALTGLVGYIAAIGGAPFYFLEEFFPIDTAMTELNGLAPNLTVDTFARFGGLINIGTALACYLYARHGARGVFDLGRPWRLGLLMLAFLCCLFSGFRSSILMLLLITALLFYTEGMFRSRMFPMLMLAVALGGISMLPFISKMPMAVQRSLAFLPVNVDPLARHSAEASSAWRFDMWKEIIPTIPKYLIKGKGLSISADDMNLIATAMQFNNMESYEGSMLAGDYHSGPLSLIIPFGLFGVGAFLWFLWASFQTLRNNQRYGDPSLHRINSFLLVFFIARVIFFFFVFGSFYGDLGLFTALVGLSVSLNDGVRQPADTVRETEWMEIEEFARA